MVSSALLATLIALVALAAGVTAALDEGGEFLHPRVLFSPWPPEPEINATAPHGNKSEPPPDSPRGCLDGLPMASRALHGLDVSSAATLFTTQRKTVDIDNKTTLAAIALARATGTAINIEDVTNHTIERLDICSFALSVGAAADSSTLQRVIMFRTTIEHNASLGPDTALQAILLNATGVPVRLEDIISFRHHEDTQRKFDREIDLSADPVLIALQSSDPEDRLLLRAVAERDAPRTTATAPVAPSPIEAVPARVPPVEETTPVSAAPVDGTLPVEAAPSIEAVAENPPPSVS